MKSLIIPDNNNGTNQPMIDEINKLLKNGKNVFLFTYMDGCGPCNSTIPEWDNISTSDKLKDHLKHGDDVVTVRINKDLFPLLKGMGSEPGGFPSLRHVTNDQVEEFEDWQSPTKSRSTDSFVEWINVKNKKQRGGKRNKNKTKKNKPRKWSIKYKKSINCKRPKGFSQKQHCKYGRKK